MTFRDFLASAPASPIAAFADLAAAVLLVIGAPLILPHLIAIATGAQ
jgi:hypothetical protein